MFIFVVHYKQSEQNEFEVYHTPDVQLAKDYVDAPVVDHVCGYLITQGANGGTAWHMNGVPKLQRRKFCGSDTVTDFIEALQRASKPLTAEDVARLHELKRRHTSQTRKDEKMAKASSASDGEDKKAKKEKKVAEPKGERAARFSPSAKAKIFKEVEKNPRKEDSDGYRSFACIKNGMTVEKYKEAGGELRFLKTEVKLGRVRIEEPEKAA